MNSKIRNAQQLRADARRDVLFDFLDGAARKHRVCPSLSEMALACECRPETSKNDLRALHKAGRITVEGGKIFRAIWVGRYRTGKLAYSSPGAAADDHLSVSRVSPAEFDRMMVERGYRFEDSQAASRPVRRITMHPPAARSGGGVSQYGD